MIPNWKGVTTDSIDKAKELAGKERVFFVADMYGVDIRPANAEEASKEAGKTKASVLILHGAADPFVPQDDVAQFEEAMLATEVDWQLIQFSNTVHSFTDPTAKMTGQAEYHKGTTDRAYAYMDQLFEGAFTSK